MRLRISLLLCLFLASSQTIARQVDGQDRDHGLMVRGKVTEIRREDKSNAVLFHVKINAQFVNEGLRPVILFSPEFDFGYWLGGWVIYANEDDAKQGKPIFADGYWQSVSGGDEERNLAEKLDVKTPPAKYTKILAVGESWEFPGEFQIYFEAEKNQRYPPHKTWKEMQAFPAKLWLTISYEISPWNVEYFRPNLLRKLAKRWKSFGQVMVEDKKEGRFNHFIISSEPMPIDFGAAASQSNSKLF
jgi:hypothetical protein